MMRVTGVFFSVLLLIGTGRATAQTSNNYADTISKHAEWYGAKKATPTLFAHLDKTVYVNNETIWFTAYLLDAGKNLSKHQILMLTLVNTADQKIAVEAKFPMDGGIGFGNVIIPDTIPAGNYSFIAQTNITNSDGKPNALFIQSITIKSATITAFNASMMLDTLYKDPDNTRVMVNVSGDNGPVDLADISYLLGKDKNTRLTGEGKTNIIGSYILLIPKNKVSPLQHNLEVIVKHGKETKTLRLDMPVKQAPPNVKFYPEGGNLIAGLNNNVGWEVKTTAGAAVKTTGILYINGKVAETIVTDSYGIGQFKVNPSLNTKYAVKLLMAGQSSEDYPLPPVLSSGVAMYIADAFADDTVGIKLLSAKPGKYTAVVHNFKQVFLTTDLQLSAKSQNLKVDVTDLPRGLSAVTVINDLNQPVAERLFFVHFAQKPVISIKVDENEPATRQKINVHLNLRGVGSKNAKALVSIACVQDNRFEIKKENNIEHYFYLQSQIDDLPLKDNLMGTAGPDRQYLNQLLLVRGWRKYNWPEMMQTTATDTSKTYNELQFSGTVYRFNSPLKKQVGLILIKDTSTVMTFNTADDGNFPLLNSTLYRKTDYKIRLIVSGQSEQFQIKITDPYKLVQAEIAKSIEPFVFERSLSDDTRQLALPASKKVTNLREVKIKASNDNSLYWRGFGPNACGDYVCRYSILNCPNHPYEPDNRPPVKGARYDTGIYRGCSINELKDGMISFDGITIAKEFYGSDYSIVNSSLPEYTSTIYWKKSLALNQGQEANLSFYASDITGKFRIVVQGVTNEDVIYGETTFEVKEKTKKTP